MKPITQKLILFLACLAFSLAVSCGGMPTTEETTTQTTSSLSAPWICSPITYDPTALVNGGWPNQGYCQWQPSPTAGVLPPNVTACNTDPLYPQGHPPSGAIDAFDHPNYTGHCARIFGGINTPLHWDYAHVVVNGWDTFEWPPNTKGPVYTHIQSVVIGNRRTSFTVWSDGGANPGSCNSDGTCKSIYNDPYLGGTWYSIPSWASLGLPANFVPAMFDIVRYCVSGC